MAWAGRPGKILLGLVVSGGLLAYVFSGVDLHAIGARLRSTLWSFLFLSVVLYFVSMWMRAWRWRYLFPPGARVGHLFRALLIGYMGNNLLPLRAGEIVRVYVASRHGPRFWTAFATVVVERVLDGLAIGLLVGVVLLIVPVPPELRWSIFLFLAVDLLGMLVLVAIAVVPEACRALIETLFHRARWIEHRLLRVLDTMIEGVSGLRAARHLAPILISSVGTWLFLAVSIWAALHAAHLDLPLAAAWTVLAFLGLGVSLPSSPGFVGVIQAATMLALALFGVERTDALSFSLLLHASQFVPVTAVGLGCLFAEHVRLTDVARADVGGVAASGR
ncbi:MAG TPA: lysylphosphatidylglycerol synthase transmembrane domain-containing protein [Methylomirabilota bacterium]|nr:lysylphosphatidylglycerol synthase transmembrane domain-containing protein [Methylomirabilota bacterium]